MASPVVLQRTSERLLTTAEAAERLGLKECTIRKRILQRSMAYVKIGRAVRVAVEEVNRLIANGWRDIFPVVGPEDLAKKQERIRALLLSPIADLKDG